MGFEFVRVVNLICVLGECYRLLGEFFVVYGSLLSLFWVF